MSNLSENMLVDLKDDDWFNRQSVAGKCAADCIKLGSKLISEKTPNLSLKDIEAACLEVMEQQNCIATFKGYKGSSAGPGFPGAVCLSVNNQLVHGIPTDYILQEGDVVKLDLGATYQGAIADTATTVIYGEPKKQEHLTLIQTCKKALDNAIKAVAVGKQLGVIGAAIHHTVKNTRFGLITNYGGHGISENKPHASPFVPNKSQSNTGIRIQPGLTIAIEPMVVIGDNRTRKLADGWTIVTDGVGAHFEHTIFVGNDKVHIMTEVT